MPVPIDITCRRFGRLIAIAAVDRKRWRFRCDCGNETVAFKSNVKRGLTTSCGCFRREVSSIRNTRHGHTRALNGVQQRSKTYAAWGSMMERCYNPRTKQFRDWGGRGITVCERWHAFENFLADIGECPPSLTLDRIDNDLGYSPENCRWATRLEQGRNKRGLKLSAETAALIRADPRRKDDIAAAFGVSRFLVYQIKAGKLWR